MHLPDNLAARLAVEAYRRGLSMDELLVKRADPPQACTVARYCMDAMDN